MATNHRAVGPSPRTVLAAEFFYGVAIHPAQEFCRLPLHLGPSMRCLASAHLVCAFAALVLLLAAGSASSARAESRTRHTRSHAHRYLLANVALPDVGFIADDQPEDGQKYELRLTRRTGESLDVVYRIGDAYISDALDNLSQFLRDNHNEEVKSYDPRLFDLLHTMLRMVNRSSSAIEVLCGYRSRETNDALRATRTTNAAEHSQHIEASAVDFRVPGIPAAELRDAALSLKAGGVGYYPKGQFVHVDTGSVRKWSFVRRRAAHKRHHRHS